MGRKGLLAIVLLSLFIAFIFKIFLAHSVR